MTIGNALVVAAFTTPGRSWDELLAAALILAIVLPLVLIRGSAAERQVEGEEAVARARAEGIPNPWRAAGYSRFGFGMIIFFLVVLVGSFMIK